MMMSSLFPSSILVRWPPMYTGIDTCEEGALTRSFILFLDMFFYSLLGRGFDMFFLLFFCLLSSSYAYWDTPSLLLFTFAFN